MEKLINSIVKHSDFYRSKELSIVEIHECKRRLIDVIACGLAAFNEPTVSISRDLASRYQLSSRLNFPNVLGASLNVSTEMAAFSNAFGIRYFDGADTFPGGGGHPSDCWAGLIALAQQENLDFKSLFKSILLAYDVFYELFKASNLREKNIDNAFYVTLATAVGASHMLGLNAEKFSNAISLAIVPNVTLGVARTGRLSMWKAGASANAVRNGLFAAIMAKEGLTGPELPFSGERGLFSIGSIFDIDFQGSIHRPRVFDAHMKRYLCDYHSQVPIDVAIELHSKIDLSEIVKVEVSTYWFAWNEVASDPSKWRPRNRETADHSLPWIVSAVLIDGVFSESIFSSARFDDHQVIELCSRVEVKEDPFLSSQFPSRMPCIIKVYMKDGLFVEATADLPCGHPEMPLSDADVESKFFALAQQSITFEQAQKLLTSLWGVNSAESTRDLFNHCHVN